MIDNPFDELTKVLRQQRELNEAMKRHSHSMACLLVGNLRHCCSGVLSELKKELRDYNIHTGEWKQK